MGNSFTKDLNKVFGQGPAASEGGMAAGTSPEDWNQQPAGEGRPGQDTPTAPPVQAPAVPKYVAPDFYSPKQAQLQSATFDPRSTSHGYLQRFGAASHF